MISQRMYHISLIISAGFAKCIGYTQPIRKFFSFSTSFAPRTHLARTMLDHDRLTLLGLTLMLVSPFRYLHEATDAMAGSGIRCSSEKTTSCCTSLTTQLRAASANAVRLADAAGRLFAERREGLQLDLHREELLNIFFEGRLVTSNDAEQVARQLESCVWSASYWIEGDPAASMNTSESAHELAGGWRAVTPAYTVRRPASPLGWLRRSAPEVHVAPSFFTFDETTQALTLLHECVHVSGFGVDHAYLHERAFASLRAEQALSNPDSIALFVLVAASWRLDDPHGERRGPAWLAQTMLRDGSERDGVLRVMADWVRFSTWQLRESGSDGC